MMEEREFLVKLALVAGAVAVLIFSVWRMT